MKKLISAILILATVFAMMVPALTMRSFADEYRNRTLEIIMAQPLSRQALVWGKFFAAWTVCAIMLLSTFWIWWGLASLLQLDNFWIFWCYIAAFLMSGALCAISVMTSAFFTHVLAAFVIAMAACFLLINVDFGWIVRIFTTQSLLTAKIAGSFSFLPQYSEMISGQLRLSSLLYFVSLSIAFVGLTGLVLDYKRR